MAVRITESRVPGGFSAVEELGEAVTSADGNYALVSYLASPLRAHPTLLKLRNRYVVFVNTAVVAAPADYEWVFEFFGADPANPIHTTQPRLTDNGVCSLDVAKIPEIFDVPLTHVIVTVTLRGVVDPLVLDQPVSGLFADIEELIASDAPESIARGGNPPTTRAIANRYRAYIADSESADPLTGVPPNLVAAITYLMTMASTDDVREEQAEAWESYVDGAGDETTVPRVALGVTQLHPYIVSMFIDGQGSAPGVTDTDAWATETEAYAVFQSRVSRAFHAAVSSEQPPVAATQRSDYVNLLRFPKSALKVTRVLLDTLLAQHQAWVNLSRANLVQNRTAVEVLTSECEVGPFEGEPKLTPVGRGAFNQMFTPYIQAIVKSSYERFFLPDAAAGEVVDIDTQPTLQLHLVRTLEEVEGVGDNVFEILISVYIVKVTDGGPDNYEIFRLIGQVQTLTGVRKLTFAFPPPPFVRGRPSLANEPGWPDAPLFGRKAKLSVLDTNGVPFEGADETDLSIPTLRYGEMWNPLAPAPVEEQLLLQFGVYINGILETPPVQTKIRWKTMKQTIVARITEAQGSDSDYETLSYKIDPSLLTNTSVKLQKKGHHLETIVLHSVSTWVDPDARGREDHVPYVKDNPSDEAVAHKALEDAAHLNLPKNHAHIDRLFDVNRCIEIWNHYPGGYPHYILGRGGELVELRSPRRVTAHAGGAFGADITYGNTRSIGIEIVGVDDTRRKSMVNTYQTISTTNNADSDALKASKEAWTNSWKAFVVANGGEAITAANTFDADNSFFDYTKQQYKALQILLETLGERYGYIRICSHNWIDRGVEGGARRRTDPGEEFDFAEIAGSLVTGGPVQRDPDHLENGFVYMISGKANGDSRK